VTRRPPILPAVLSAAIAAGLLGIAISTHNLEPRLREWVVSSLSHSLESEVELGSITLDWIPLKLRARDLVVRHHGRTDIPPLLVVSSFTVDLKPTELWSSTIGRVTVDGLEVNIPPKDPETGKRPLPEPSPGSDDSSSSLVVKRLTATNTRLSVIPREAGKNAKVWDIFELDMTNLRAGEAATFVAALVNPIPYGKVEASGRVGPWQSDEPGTSAIAGEYTFAADLGTIAGLGGDLSAVGTMEGTIERLATRGDTRTREFRLTDMDGLGLPLRTSYDAVVDGTKGDVELRRVDVDLGNSHFHASGAVEGTTGKKGKRVVVNLKSESADLAELLRFVSKAAQPPASGTLTIDAALDLPQGPENILDRVKIEGSVKAERVKFTNRGVQDKIDELSRRGQGRPTDMSIDEMASRMSTKFALDDGVFTYQGLSFNVEGATVTLDGTHSLRSKSVRLAGVVLLSATVSRTQTGFRSWLLRPFDPLFRKNGAGTRLAIRVEGTQDQPKVGLEIGRTLRGS
jgi:hypothetical protein